ncbi:MAG: ATP-binding protein [Aquificae bacterium]|nr:ATP-binding protein [Aquificota bacterium]
MKKKDILKELIIDFQGKKLPLIIERDIVIPINTKKIISVIGVRRSGKTYALFQTIKKLLKNTPIEKIVYISFEDERLELKAEELSLLIEAYKELYPEIPLNEVYFFFDEIQNIEGWERFVRRVYDNYSKNIFITGSNSKLFSTEIATSLRGRTITYKIFPLSFKEFLKFKNFEFEKKYLYSLEKKTILKNLFNEYMKFGGFPEVVKVEDENLKIKILQEYFEVMLYKDIVERYHIKSPTILKYFTKRLIESIGKPISINNIYNEIKSQGYKVSKDTLYEFFDMLEAVFFILIIKKFSKSILKTEFSQKKAYLVDNGFLTALTFSFLENYGKLLENILAKELIAREYELFYFKEKKECDFVAIKDKDIIPIQVSYSLQDKKTKEREIKGLLEALNYLNKKEGIILTYEEKDEITVGDKNIKIMPMYEYLLLWKEK